MDSRKVKRKKTRNSLVIDNYKAENQLKQISSNKRRFSSITSDIKRFHSAEKKLFNETIFRKKQKNITTLNTTRDNTLTSESSKKEAYYEKFVNQRLPEFSEEEIKNKLNEENNEDIEFLSNILFNINNKNNVDKFLSQNNSINTKDIKNKNNLNTFRRYLITIQKKFQKDIDGKISQDNYNISFALSYSFLKKLENLISRFSLFIFFLIQRKKIELAKNVFLLMLKENYSYIDYIERNIIAWYSTSKRKISVSKEYPKATYELIKIYSFIIKYSQLFHMMNYCNNFLKRYFDIIYFLYVFFLNKANIRGFTLDTKNQINFWLSLSLHNASYFSISNYFPLNISINLSNYIINLYQNSDENNLTNDEKSLIMKTSYNLGLLYYLNGQNDRSLSNLNNANEMILNVDDGEIFKSNVIQPITSKRKESIVLKDRYSFKKHLENMNTESNRFSIATTRSEKSNNNKDNINPIISIDKIKASFSKDKINVEDIQILINYGVNAGIMNENNSGQFKNTIRISPTNISPKYKFKYLSIPKYFNNPLLRRIELLKSEIELDKKNYNSAYDHVLKAFYILICLRLSKKGNELITFNSEQKTIKKYMELISNLNEIEMRVSKKGKSELNLSLLNQSLINNNDSFQDNSYPNRELSDKMLDKYNKVININLEEKNNLNNKKKKKEILICGQKSQDSKMIREIEKFFIFLNTLTIYQIKILNETQPDNNKSNDLPILFSSQFRDCLSHRQRIELDNVQTMALSRFVILKDTNKWIMPNNLNIGIIDEKKFLNYLKKRTIKFLNKYYKSKKNDIPLRKTREYKYFQEILKAGKDNKELKEFINNKFNYVIKLLKKLNDEEIKNIINSPNIIVEPVKKYEKRLKRKAKKNNANKEKEIEEPYKFNHLTNYDYDDNFFNSRYSIGGKLRTYSTKIKNFQNKLNSIKKREENVIDDFYQRIHGQKDKRNISVQFNINNVVNKKKDNKDYNDDYQDFQIIIGEEEEESIENNE